MRRSGAIGVHRRAAADLVANLVDDGVFDLERLGGVDGDGVVGADVLGPADGAHAVVERGVVGARRMSPACNRMRLATRDHRQAR